jgi:hypothetical protein
MKKRPSGKRTPQQQAKILSHGPSSISAEVQHIIEKAKGRDAIVVAAGGYVLFSSRTGDAWMLDSANGLALCLARNGKEQTYRIVETPPSVAIEWNARYHFERDAFVVMDTAGKTRRIRNYPAQQILSYTAKGG